MNTPFIRIGNRILNLQELAFAEIRGDDIRLHFAGHDHIDLSVDESVVFLALTKDLVTEWMPPVTITIIDMQFAPNVVTVPKDTKVMWTNTDAVDHELAGGVESPLLAPGATFERVFTSLGEFDYHCSIHPDTVGKVIVK